MRHLLGSPRAAHVELRYWGGGSTGHTVLSSRVYNCSLTCSTLKDAGMELFQSSHMENSSQHRCPSSAFLLLCPLPVSILLQQLRHLQRKALAHSSVILFLHLIQYKQKAKATFCSLVAPSKPCAGLSQSLLWKADYQDVRCGIYAGGAEGM